MFCFRTRKLLVPYAEGALGDKATEAVTKHISRCPRCAEELAVVRQACRAFRTAKTPAPEPAADLWSRIEREIAAPEPVRAPAWQMRSLQLGGAAAAATILLLAVISVGKLGEINGVGGQSPVHRENPPSVATNGGSPKISPSGAVEAGRNGDSIDKPSHPETRPHLYYDQAPTPATKPAASPLEEKSSAAMESAAPSGHDASVIGDWTPPAAPAAAVRDGAWAAKADGVDMAYRDEADLDSKLLAGSDHVFYSDPKPDMVMAAAPPELGVFIDAPIYWHADEASGDAMVSDGLVVGDRSAVGPKVSGMVAADSGLDTGSPPTSVDKLNDADTDSRVAVLFMYP